MQSINFKSTVLGFFLALIVAGFYAFAAPEESPVPSPTMSELAVEMPASGWTDLGGAVYVPSEGIYQVIYGDFGFKIVEVVGFD